LYLKTNSTIAEYQGKRAKHGQFNARPTVTFAITVESNQATNDNLSVDVFPLLAAVNTFVQRLHT